MTENAGGASGNGPPSAMIALPKVRAATFEDIRRALSKGWRDFLAAPLYGLFFGGVCAIGGVAIMAMIVAYQMSYLAYPLMAGFVLISPFVATGLYEVSRRRELGIPLSFGGVLSVVWKQGGREMGWMAFVTLFFFIIWMYQTRLLLALFLGFANFGTFTDFLRVLVTTTDGLIFLAVGNLVGAVLSALLFTITVVSFPLLLERDIDVISAIITSFRAVLASPFVMLSWAAVITILMILAMAPAFLGMLFIMPVLGHASWHLYRAIVERPVVD